MSTVSTSSLAESSKVSREVAYVAVSSANCDSVTFTTLSHAFAVRSPTNFLPCLNLTFTPAVGLRSLQLAITAL